MSHVELSWRLQYSISLVGRHLHMHIVKNLASTQNLPMADKSDSVWGKAHVYSSLSMQSKALLKDKINMQFKVE